MHDPRSQEEKARAALKRNQEMGHAPKQSPLTREPSTTDATFGEHAGKPPEAEREREGGSDAPGKRAGDPNDPRRHGHGHAGRRGPDRIPDSRGSRPGTEPGDAGDSYGASQGQEPRGALSRRG